MLLFRFFGVMSLLLLCLVACPQPIQNVPQIVSFTATPSSISAATSVKLEWVVQNASSLSISPNVGVVTGSSTTLNISASTTFELTAQNIAGTSKKTVLVTLNQNLSQFFSPDKVYSQPIPTDTQQLLPEEFKRQVEAGELRLVTAQSQASAVQQQQLEYQTDFGFLQGLSQPSTVVMDLLARVTASPKPNAEPLEMQNNSVVQLLSLAEQVQQQAQAERDLRDVAKQLLRYTDLYNLLSPDYRTDLSTPESLTGQPLEVIQTVLAALETRLTEIPNLDGETRLETAAGARLTPQVAPIPGGNPYPNQDGWRCNQSQTGLYKNFFWSLKNFVTPIRDQGRRGMCWAFTAVSALESKIAVQTGNQINLSEQFLVNKVKHDWDEEDYQDGYRAESALQDMLENNQSLPLENTWLYNLSDARAISGEDSSSKASYTGSCAAFTHPSNPALNVPAYNGSCSETAHQSALKCSTFNGTFCGYQTMTFSGVGGIASNPTRTLWSGNASNFPLDELRLRLAGGQVIMASFGVRVGFQEAQNGFVTDFSDQHRLADGINLGSGSKGGHAVTIIGFLDAASVRAAATPNGNSLPVVIVPGGVLNNIAGYFVVKNSWGCVGDGGYYYIPDTYVRQFFNRLSVLEFGGRGAAWNNQKNPFLETLGTNANIDTDLRSPTALFRVAAPQGQPLSDLTVQISSNNPSDNFSSSDFFGIRTYSSTFGSAGIRVLSITVRNGTANQQVRFLTVNVKNTAPNAIFTMPSPIYTYSSSLPTPEFSLGILDKNEADPQTLCPNVRWEVDLPDLIESNTITNTVIGGCKQKIRFASAGYREVRVSITDSDGLSGSSFVNVPVQNPPVNPYPIISSGGVQRWDRLNASGLCIRDFALRTMLDLRSQTPSTNCSGQPNPSTFYASISVQNPDAEFLVYDWKLTLVTPTGNYSSGAFMTSSAENFAIPVVNYGSGGTFACNVQIRLLPNNNSSRERSQTVWSGQCQVAAVVPR